MKSCFVNLRSAIQRRRNRLTRTSNIFGNSFPIWSTETNFTNEWWVNLHKGKVTSKHKSLKLNYTVFEYAWLLTQGRGVLVCFAITSQTNSHSKPATCEQTCPHLVARKVWSHSEEEKISLFTPPCKCNDQWWSLLMSWQQLPKGCEGLDWLSVIWLHIYLQ